MNEEAGSVKLHEVPAPGSAAGEAAHASVVISSETYWYYTIGLSDYGYRTVIFSAIELSEDRISYWRTQETIGLSDIGSKPKSIRLSDIGLRKNYRLPTSALQLKAALRAKLACAECPEHLPWVLLGLRSPPNENSAVSSAELMFTVQPNIQSADRASSRAVTGGRS
jgi:hypothetical protein